MVHCIGGNLFLTLETHDHLKNLAIVNKLRFSKTIEPTHIKGTKKPSTLPKSTANFIIERIAQLIRAYIQHE